jgi:hypothetical protein
MIGSPARDGGDQLLVDADGRSITMDRWAPDASLDSDACTPSPMKAVANVPVVLAHSGRDEDTLPKPG